MRTAASVSVLFTDLVGSTAMAAELGADGAEDLRRTHFALLREAVDEHGGREVKNLGDGLMVAFTGVGAALDAAVAMQQAIDRHNRSGGSPLAVRIGVATGDAEEDGGDLFGEPVVQAARLCAAAEGGAILVPEVLRHLAPRGAHEYRSIGELELKGLPEPIATAEVVWVPTEDGTGVIDLPLPARLCVPHLAGFVGRTDERERLDAARKAAATGERRGVLIAGEAGMGKTRLVSEVAVTAHEAGAAVLYGRCDEELAIPYQPWAEAIGYYATHAGTEALARHDATRLAELTRLAPELYQQVPDLGVPVSTDAATERHLLFGAVVTLLAEIGRRQLCVLVLDDLHWADRPTVQLLRHVLSTVDLGAVLVVATYRDTDLDADHPMTDALAGLHREPGVDVVTLHGLGDTEIVALLESIAGHELPDDGVALAHAVRAETDGNPFFVGEILRHLAETGAIIQQDGRWVANAELAEVGLPASIRAVVGQRVRRLGDTAHHVLTTAAVVGREFEVDVVAVVAQVDEDAVLDALDAATTAGLVAESATAADRFTFTHALVQHTLYDELTGPRRVRLHHRVAEALESQLGDEPGDRIGELAHHWLAATRPADVDKAIGYARRAGDRAMGALAYDDAARWYAQALAALEQGSAAEPRRRCELLVALGRALEADRAYAGMGTLVEAGELAASIGADDLLVEAVRFSVALDLGKVNDRVVALAERALEVTDEADSAQRAVLLAHLAHQLQWARPPDRAHRLAAEAVETARRSSDPRALTLVTRRLDFINTPDHLEELAVLTGDALAMAAVAADPLAEADIALHRTTVVLQTGDVEAAREAFEHVSYAAVRSGWSGSLWWRAIQRSRLELLAGDTAAAEATAAEALTFTDDPTHSTVYGIQLYSIRHHQGRLHELVGGVERAASSNPDVASFQAVVPWVLAHAGDHDRAHARLADLRTRLEVPWDGLWLNCNWLIGEAAAAAGDPDTAEESYRQLLPWGHLVSATSVTCDGPIAQTLGLLADVLGRTDDAVAHLEAALAISERLEAPFHVARAECSLGRLRSDLAQIEDALAIARRHGFAGVEAAATDALRSLD